MEWYRYNPETLEYEHPVVCQPNPARPGEYLIPPSATEKEPPEASENSVAVFEHGNWIIKSDYRGHEYWLPDGTKNEITEIGVTPPDNALDSPPPPTENEKYQTLIHQRNVLLRSSDWIIQRKNDELLIGAPSSISYECYMEVQHWRQSLRDLPEHYRSSETWVWPEVPTCIAGIITSPTE